MTTPVKRGGWKGLSTIAKVSIIVGAVMVLACFGCVANMFSPVSAPATTDLPTVTATTDQPGTSAQPVANPTTEAPPAAQPVTLNGSGSKVMDIGATLNGAYRVDYHANGSFLIVEFLNSSGDDGSGFMETINEYAGSGSVEGSTVVHLKNVSMIKTSNTRSNWTVTFTPLG